MSASRRLRAVLPLQTHQVGLHGAPPLPDLLDLLAVVVKVAAHLLQLALTLGQGTRRRAPRAQTQDGRRDEGLPAPARRVPKGEAFDQESPQDPSQQEGRLRPPGGPMARPILGQGLRQERRHPRPRSDPGADQTRRPRQAGQGGRRGDVLPEREEPAHHGGREDEAGEGEDQRQEASVQLQPQDRLHLHGPVEELRHPLDGLRGVDPGREAGHVLPLQTHLKGSRQGILAQERDGLGDVRVPGLHAGQALLRGEIVHALGPGQGQELLLHHLAPLVVGITVQESQDAEIVQEQALSVERMGPHEQDAFPQESSYDAEEDQH